MSTTSIFGFAHDDLDAVHHAIGQALGVDLEMHDSHYLGQYSRGSLGGGQSIRLRHNADPLFDEVTDPPRERYSEPEFPDFPLLLYLHGVSEEQARRLLQHVAGVSFLAAREIA